MYTARDVANPQQAPTLGRGTATYRYIFANSNITPKVGESIGIGGRTMTINKIERPNVPGQSGAVVQAS